MSVSSRRGRWWTAETLGSASDCAGGTDRANNDCSHPAPHCGWRFILTIPLAPRRARATRRQKLGAPRSVVRRAFGTVVRDLRADLESSFSGWARDHREGAPDGAGGSLGGGSGAAGGSRFSSGDSIPRI